MCWCQRHVSIHRWLELLACVTAHRNEVAVHYSAARCSQIALQMLYTTSNDPSVCIIPQNVMSYQWVLGLLLCRSLLLNVHLHSNAQDSQSWKAVRERELWNNLFTQQIVVQWWVWRTGQMALLEHGVGLLYWESTGWGPLWAVPPVEHKHTRGGQLSFQRGCSSV